jgi:hypothetical protein
MSEIGPNDLISFTDAAREKDCGRNTLYRAADRGQINTIEVSGRKMIVKDAAYRTFEPQWTGARARQEQENEDD